MGWLIDWLIISLSLSLCLPIVYSDGLTDWFINCFSVSPYLLFILIGWSIVSLSLSPLLLFRQNDQFFKKIDSVSVSLYSIPTNCLRFFWWFSLYFVHFSNKLIVFFINSLFVSLYVFYFDQIDCLSDWFSLCIFIFSSGGLTDRLIHSLFPYLLFMIVDGLIDSLSVSLSPLQTYWSIISKCPYVLFRRID